MDTSRSTSSSVNTRHHAARSARHSRIPALAGAMPLMVLAALGSAQALAAEPPTEPSTTPERSPLAGPALGDPDAGAQRTLVRRAYDGSLIRLETLPEAAALELVELDPVVRAEADRILTERASIIDGIVADNLDVLVRLESASQGGRGSPEALGVYREMLGLLAPLRERRPLAERLARTMPEPAASRYRSLVEQYRDALIEEDLRGAREQGQADPSRRRAQIRVTLGLMGQELSRSFDRQFRQGQREELDRLLDMVGVTPKQRREIETILQESISDQIANGKPTRTDRARLTMRIFRVLTPEQRRALIEARRASGRDPG